MIDHLIVSSINNIEVHQIGESKISFKNKSEDRISRQELAARGKRENKKKLKTGVVESFKKHGKEFISAVATIDLGVSKIVYTFKIFVTNNNDKGKLIKILSAEKFCTIQDKFNGELKCHIESFDMTDNDQHIGRTIFNINCNVQSKVKPQVPKKDVKTAIDNAKDKVQKGIADTVKDPTIYYGITGEYEGFNLKEFIADVHEGKETIFNSLDTVLSFYDEVFIVIEDGIELVFSMRDVVSGSLKKVNDRVDRSKRLHGSLKLLAKIPSDFLNMINEFIDNILPEKPFFEPLSIIPISKPLFRGRYYDELRDGSIISQIEKDEHQRQATSHKLVNTVAFLVDVNLLLKGTFITENSLLSLINSLLERIHYIGLNPDEIDELSNHFKSMFNDSFYGKIVEVDVEETSLVRLVYERYGDLDQYNNIVALNNIKDLEWINGKVKLLL